MPPSTPPAPWTPATSSAGRRSRAATRATPAAVTACAQFNLRRYADAVRGDWRYRKDSFRTDRSKTPRGLGAFDCIAAPCLDECPVDQQVPRYMAAVRSGEFAEAVRITRLDNPLPAVLGRVCDHLCENTCIRTHLDQPLAIRQIKRFIMDQEREASPRPAPSADGRPRGHRRGRAGRPCGRRVAGVRRRPRHDLRGASYAGGMVGGAIPAYRLPQAQIDQDLGVLERLGVEIRYGQRAGVDFTLDELRAAGFAAIFVAVGAQLAKRLGLPGEDARGVIDGVTFLRSVREGRPVAIGARVAWWAPATPPWTACARRVASAPRPSP